MAEVFGLEVADLPAGHVPVRVLVVVETLLMEEVGDVRKLSTRVSEGLTYWDVMGMAAAAKVDAEAQWLAAPDDGTSDAQ